MSVIRYIFICMLIVCLCGTHLGCAQLFMIPAKLIGFLIQIPFLIIKIVIALLPIAIKYAPLALLFVSNNDEESLQELETIVEDMNREDVRCRLAKYSLTPAVSCYQLEFVDKLDGNETLVKHIEKMLIESVDARILLAGEIEDGYTQEKVSAIWQYMVYEDIKVGQDNRLPYPTEVVDTHEA